MRTSPPQYAFSSGEISPLLFGRPDYQRHQTGLKRCCGWLPLRQGGITRAPGTIFRGNTKSNAAARLISFEFAVNDAVTLEFSNGIMRVWRYGALVDSGGSPYELVIPYDAAAIARLKWVQSADVIYMVDGVLPPQKLSRLALNNWTIGDTAFDRGPFQAQNLDETLTITSSAETGTVTLAASANLFVAGHVDGLFLLRVTDEVSIPTWTGNTTVVVGDQMRYDGNIYEVTAGTNTGVNPPTHPEGDVKVEKTGITWRYISDDFGICRIVSIASGISAQASVIKRIPKGCVTSPTYRWQEGAWSTKNGYPSAIAIYEQRLDFAATPAAPRTIWFSTLGAYTNFEPGYLVDGSFAYTIGGSESQNKIIWLKGGSRGLHIGALGEEYSSRSTTAGEAIGALNVAFKRDTQIGSKDVRAIAPDGKPIFISRDGARIFEIAYAFDQDRNAPRELSLPSEHLGASGFEEIVWQGAPLRIGWVRRGGGDVAQLIYDPQEEVLGWSWLPVAGGIVESMAVSKDAAGQVDIVTMVVQREVNGSTVRFVEEIALSYGVLTGAQPISEAVHLFASTVIVPGAATDTFAVPHLEGEEVYVWTDQGELGPVTVTGGSVTVAAAVSRATIGLFDATHSAMTLDVKGQAQDGATLGRQKRVKAFGMRLHRTAAIEARMIESNFGEVDVVSPFIDITNRSVPSDLLNGSSGVVDAPIPSGWAREVSYEFRPVGGAPATIAGIVPIIETAGG